MIKSLSIFVFIILISGISRQALSVNVTDDFQSVLIEDTHLIIEQGQNDGILEFRITNQSNSKLTILGVRGPNNEKSKILVKTGEAEYADLGSITLAAEESIDLSTSHIFMKLTGFVEPVRIDRKIDLVLVLATGEIPFAAHVKLLKSK